MAQKEGTIFILVGCSNCGCVLMCGWSFKPKENEETEWTAVCPVCKMPVKVVFTVN